MFILTKFILVVSMILQDVTKAVNRNRNTGNRKRNEAGLLIFSINNLSEKILGCVPLGESESGFLICGAPFEQIHFQICDLSNPLCTRIHWITDLRDLKTDH